MSRQLRLRNDINAVLAVTAWCAIIILPFWLGAIAVAVVIGWAITLLWMTILLWAYLRDRFAKRNVAPKRLTL
jgi:hypothetical protein